MRAECKFEKRGIRHYPSWVRSNPLELNVVSDTLCELRLFPIITRYPSSRHGLHELPNENAKVISIALSSIQRLIALCAVSLSAIPAIIQTINDHMSQGVDIQLKILQILSLITNSATIHGRLLANSHPRDAFDVFENLSLSGNGEHPQFIQLECSHQTFAIELIESVLMNYSQLFRKHFELILLLQHRLFPMLFKTLSERSASRLALRGTRVFSAQAFPPKLETEATLGLLIKLIDSRIEGTRERLSIAWPPQLGQSRGDGGDGCQRDGVDVVGMIDTEARLRVQTAAMKLDKTDTPLIPDAYIYLLGVQCLISIVDGLTGYGLPLYLAVQNPPTGSTEPVH
ncbi:hypothetical protein BGY98DRAFT_1116908, partial [Russula aff. rugulosa BPL654]